MVSSKNVKEAKRINHVLLLHNAKDGGITAGIFGKKGAGKTTEAINLAENVAYIDPRTGQAHRETVIWCAQGVDYWTSLDLNRVHVFHHVDYLPTFYAEDTSEIEPPVRPGHMHHYTSTVDLIRKILPGMINVIYSPKVFRFSKEVADEIEHAGMLKKSLSDDDVKINPDMFWFEMLHYLRKRKHRLFFITVIMDEAGRLLPENTSRERFAVQGWFIELESIHLRRSNISFFIFAHSAGGIDWRYHDKIMIYGWMKGAKPNSLSMLNKKLTFYLNRGVIILEESGLYGNLDVPYVAQRPLIYAEYEDRSDEADTEDFDYRESIERQVPPAGVGIYQST